jgi:hypothetical protein
MPLPFSILSGGQTGADRAALDFALKYQIPHGGWCPKGRSALDGPLDAKYLLKETPSEDALERTEWNVRDAEAVIIFTRAPKAAGGSAKAITLAKKQKKPVLHIHQGLLGAHMKIIEFLVKHQARRLNIGGSSEADEPGIYDWVTLVLEKMQAEIENRRSGRGR